MTLFFNLQKSIVEQIEQITEIENLKEASSVIVLVMLKIHKCLNYNYRHVSIQGWRIQAEANDEVERLLSSQPGMTEQEETHGHASVSKHL